MFLLHALLHISPIRWQDSSFQKNIKSSCPWIYCLVLFRSYVSGDFITFSTDLGETGSYAVEKMYMCYVCSAITLDRWLFLLLTYLLTSSLPTDTSRLGPWVVCENNGGRYRGDLCSAPTEIQVALLIIIFTNWALRGALSQPCS